MRATEVIDGTAEYIVIVLVVGWPVFLPACLALAAYLSRKRRLPLRTVIIKTLLTLMTLVLTSFVFWRFMPPFGPMLGFVHLPSAIACVVVVPAAAWWWGRRMTPNNRFQAGNHG